VPAIRARSPHCMYAVGIAGPDPDVRLLHEPHDAIPPDGSAGALPTQLTACQRLSWCCTQTRPVFTCHPDPTNPAAGVCNAYLCDMPSAFDRLLWAVSLLARNGFLVIPVSQLEQDPTLMEDRTTQWAEVNFLRLLLITQPACDTADSASACCMMADRTLHSPGEAVPATTLVPVCKIP